MKIKVAVTIWYNDNSKEQIDYFMNEINQYPEDYFNVITPKFKINEIKTKHETLTLYAKDENEKPFQLPNEIVSRIVNPGKEWEGTPLLEINYDGNNYLIICAHIDEY